MLRGGVSKINDLFDYLQCIAAGLDSQKSKKSNWSEQSKVGKQKFLAKKLALFNIRLIVREHLHMLIN